MDKHIADDSLLWERFIQMLPVNRDAVTGEH